jgi:hypothetical protein
MHCSIVGGVKYHLGEAIAITQVNENQRAVVTAAMHPPGQGNGLVVMTRTEFTARMCTIHKIYLL